MINNNTDFILNNKKYKISSLSLLQNFKKKNLNIKPYPYLSIKNALPEEIYEHLSNNYPSDEIIIIESMKYKLESKLLKLHVPVGFILFGCKQKEYTPIVF